MAGKKPMHTPLQRTHTHTHPPLSQPWSPVYMPTSYSSRPSHLLYIIVTITTEYSSPPCKDHAHHEVIQQGGADGLEHDHHVG